MPSNTSRRTFVKGLGAATTLAGLGLWRPLAQAAIRAGLLPADFPVCLPSVSGYSGGGRTMIEDYEAGRAPAYEAYALGLQHKHIPEILRYTGMTRRPLFVPAVGNFRQGMLVQLPIHLDMLPAKPKAALKRAFENRRKLLDLT